MSSSGVAILIITDDLVMGIAERRHQGVDIYAQPGDNPWGPPRGAFPDPVRHAAHLAPR